MKISRLKYLSTGILLFIFFSSLFCSKANEAIPENVKDIVTQVKQAHCPDRRVGVFDVEARKQGNSIVLTGDVMSAEAKAELKARLSSETKFEVIDSTRVLPDTSLKGNIHGVINVSVAQLRRHGNVHHETISQATLGTEVKILKRKGRMWVYCQLEDDYLGWLMKSALEIGNEDFIQKWRESEKVMVSENHEIIWEKPVAHGKTVSDAVWGNILIDRGRKGRWRHVELPDGRDGYIPLASVIDLKKMETVKQDPQKMVELAQRLIGIPYLWGGRSTKGFDCSGFTQTLYKSIGIMLPRDANMQVKSGKEVVIDDELNNLKTGDLLFFGRNIDRITHVGMYIGDKKVIHSDGRVRINSFNPEDEEYSEYRRNGLQAVRRILGE